MSKETGSSEWISREKLTLERLSNTLHFLNSQFFFGFLTEDVTHCCRDLKNKMHHCQKLLYPKIKYQLCWVVNCTIRMNSSSSFTRALNPDCLIGAGIIVNLTQNLIMMSHTSQSKAHGGKTLVKSCPTDLDPSPSGYF